ncbi:PREDICTED: reverse mRNAase [Prunus dulcis]|uniref:PREDICTED: reverse mRNAase n=1 Tax=Prunus dulcis TaxID=3755 RepID=A0A5E4FU03_PRUDU|nr:PREDICTED: reverse mRNAase [Prunus dulcis]
MWMLWTERNNILFGGNPLSVVELVMQAKNDHMELKAAEVGCHRSASLPAPAVRWQPPQQGFLKLNVDAAVDIEGLVSAVSMQAPGRVSFLATELYAMKIGLSFALEAAVVPLVVESYSLLAVQLVAVQHISRNANMLAHRIAKFNLRVRGFDFWMEARPRWLMDCVL